MLGGVTGCNLTPVRGCHTVLTPSQIATQGRPEQRQECAELLLNRDFLDTSCSLFKPKPHARAAKADLAERCYRAPLLFFHSSTLSTSPSGVSQRICLLSGQVRNR